MNKTQSSDSNLPHEPAREKLNFATKLAYGAGDMGSAMTANVLVFFLLYFFTNVAGLPAGLAGSILMIGKISDAINDPIVGVMSDRTRTKWGRRLPWMLWGAIPFGLLFFLQWIVPSFSSNEVVNTWLLFAYYVVIGILFNIAYTAINLPYTALTPELTQDYNERTSLNSFRFAFSIGAGSILSLILAFLVLQQYKDAEGEGFFVLAIICAILSILPTLWCTLRVQEKGSQPILDKSQKKFLGIGLSAVSAFSLSFSFSRLILGGNSQLDLMAIFALIAGLILAGFAYTLFFSNPESHLLASPSSQENLPNSEESLPFAEQLKIAFRNKPFLFVIGIYLCSWLAVQLTASILIYYVVSWMGMTSDASTLVALAVQGTAFITLFLWRWISEKAGKKVVYFAGTVIWMVAQAGLFLLQPDQVTLMYILATMAGFGVSVAYLIPWSMVPDVIELDELRTGQRREGVFYGFMVLLQKFCLALAIWIVGIGLDLAGFIERLPGEEIPVQPDSALFAIRLAIGPLPTVALIGGLILAYFYPITKEYHQQIRLQLAERKRGE